MGEIDDIILRDKERKLFISRVPKNVKEEFITLAEELFEEDYGMCLKWILEQAIEYQKIKVSFFENINYKLDNILGIISQTEQKPEQKEKISMLSGRKVEKEVKDGKN